MERDLLISRHSLISRPLTLKSKPVKGRLTNFSHSLQISDSTYHTGAHVLITPAANDKT